jgi:dolichyl-diphosphooligosaccharide--protein glycosyltransferase
MGRNIADSAYPGIPFAAAFLYLVQKTIGLGISLYDICLFFPVFMAIVTVVTIYFLGKELSGKPTGIFAALFMSITPAFIQRTSMGFFDTENIGIFAIIATSLLFLRSSDKQRSLNRRVIYGVLSGLTLGLIYASWGGAKYMTGLLMLYMIFLVISERYETRHLITYCITIGLGFLTVFFIQKLGPASLMGLDSVAAVVLVIILFIYELIGKKIDLSLVSVSVAGLFLIVILAIFFLPVIGINIPIGFKFLKALNPFTSTDSYLYESVAENHVIPWASLFNNYGIILPLGVFGTYLCLKNLNERNLFAVLFFLTGLYFAGVMSRLTQILSAPACLLGAYGLVQSLSPFFKEQALPSRRTAKRRKIIFGVSNSLVIVFAGFLLVAMIPNVLSAINSADGPTQLASSGISIPVGGEYTKDWPDTLEWMRTNVEDDAVICSWWDYGYWIEAVAGKITMADGSTRINRQIANIGKIMMLKPNESIKILEKYDADYVVVFVTYDPNNINTQWPFGDNVKWQWMVQISGLELSEYVNFTAGNYKQAFLDSTLVKLMYQLPPFDVFEPVYVSEHGFVLVYKINYPEKIGE